LLSLLLFGHPCGDDGARYQIVYATPGVDRSDELAPLFGEVITRINDTFGGRRELRLACGLRVVKSTTGDKMQQIMNAVRAEKDRKYLVFVDEPIAVPCGWGTVIRDDRPGPENLNNSVPAWAVLWSNCWFGQTPAHEISHTLGAVQLSAPFSDASYHCFDPKHRGGVYECGQENYYDPNPAPGSYLATHWNIANSRFLDITEPPPLTVVETPPVYTLYIP
jgi:hypothetical protein